jgi:hypothetical protein
MSMANKGPVEISSKHLRGLILRVSMPKYEDNLRINFKVIAIYSKQ